MTEHASRVALAATLALTACEGEVPGTPPFTARDSAGVTIVESSAHVWADGEGWHLSPQPEVVIGLVEGDERYLLHDPRGARRLPDGRIAVLDVGSNRVRVYDGRGEHLVDMGGRGGGGAPWELESPQYVGLVGDTIVVYGYFPGTLTWFTADGEFVRRVETPRPPDGTLLRAVAFGFLGSRWGVAYGLPSDPRYFEGINRHARPLWRFELDGPALDSIGSIPGEEYEVSFPRPGTRRNSPYLFGKTAYVGASDSWIYVAPTDDYSVRVLDEAGVLRRIVRRAVEPRRVTGGDVARFVEQRVRAADVQPEQRGLWEAQLRDAPVADFMPAFRWTAVDAEENLWVEDWADVGLGQGPFSVFRPDGAWLGTVDVPEGLSPDRGRALLSPWLEIGSDYLLGVWVDGMGVEQVRMYRIHKE